MNASAKVGKASLPVRSTPVRSTPVREVPGSIVGLLIASSTMELASSRERGSTRYRTKMIVAHPYGDTVVETWYPGTVPGTELYVNHRSVKHWLV